MFTQKHLTATTAGSGKAQLLKRHRRKEPAALRHGVELPGKLFGLHDLRQRGHRVDLAKREAIDGTNYYSAANHAL